MHPNWRYPPRRPAIRTALRGSAVAGVLQEPLRKSFLISLRFLDADGLGRRRFRDPERPDSDITVNFIVLGASGGKGALVAFGVSGGRSISKDKGVSKATETQGLSALRRLHGFRGSGRPPLPARTQVATVTGSHSRQQPAHRKPQSPVHQQPHSPPAGNWKPQDANREPEVSETTNREPGI